MKISLTLNIRGMRLLFHCGQDRSSDDRNLGDELLEDVENARVVHRHELTKVLHQNIKRQNSKTIKFLSIFWKRLILKIFIISEKRIRWFFACYAETISENQEQPFKFREYIRSSRQQNHWLKLRLLLTWLTKTLLTELPLMLNDWRCSFLSSRPTCN